MIPNMAAAMVPGRDHLFSFGVPLAVSHNSFIEPSLVQRAAGKQAYLSVTSSHELIPHLPLLLPDKPAFGGHRILIIPAGQPGGQCLPQPIECWLSGGEPGEIVEFFWIFLAVVEGPFRPMMQPVDELDIPWQG